MRGKGHGPAHSQDLPASRVSPAPAPVTRVVNGRRVLMDLNAGQVQTHFSAPSIMSLTPPRFLEQERGEWGSSRNLTDPRAGYVALFLWWRFSFSGGYELLSLTPRGFGGGGGEFHLGV